MTRFALKSGLKSDTKPFSKKIAHSKRGIFHYFLVNSRSFNSCRGQKHNNIKNTIKDISDKIVFRYQVKNGKVYFFKWLLSLAGNLTAAEKANEKR